MCEVFFFQNIRSGMLCLYYIVLSVTAMRKYPNCCSVMQRFSMYGEINLTEIVEQICTTAFKYPEWTQRIKGIILGVILQCFADDVIVTVNYFIIYGVFWMRQRISIMVWVGLNISYNAHKKKNDGCFLSFFVSFGKMIKITLEH